MKVSGRILAFAGILVSLLPIKAEPLTEQLRKTIVYDDIAISRDGAWVAWVQGTAGTESAWVHVASTAPGSIGIPVRPPADNGNIDSDPAWSPDSKTLVFVSMGKDRSSSRLSTVTWNGSRTPISTNISGYLARPRWSHDGRRIAFLFIEGNSGGGPLMAAPTRTGLIDTEIHNQRIAVLDVTTGTFRQTSSPNFDVYDFDWSPDDQSFVATAAPGPGDNNWWVAQLYIMRLASGEATSIYKPSYQLAIPRWSPDGNSIAFIEGLMSDEGFHGGDLFTISATGGPVVNRTKGRKSSISSLIWMTPDRCLLTEVVGGDSAISELQLSSNEVRTLWRGGEAMHAYGNFPNFAVSTNGTFSATVRSGFQNPPEIWVGSVGQWHQLTSLNQSQTASWGTAESLEWSNGGFNVQGWLLPPREVRAGTRYPLIVEVHGGPSGVAQPEWPAKFPLDAIFASQGYYVLFPNPRGSYGQGEDFTRANVRDFGAGDLSDVLAGIDAAIAKFPIDPDRIGITGWSYGGYATMWAVTQTHRFRAAVAGAGIANWQSYYGQNLIDQWMIPFFGASVYDYPAIYAKSSPINFIKSVQTPTLVVVGEQDAECPAPQSFEFWHALRTLKVPTELVVYPGEGHMFMNPTNRVDCDDRCLDWFNKYLK